MVTAHAAAVALTGGRYPFRPTCTCGWEWRGYVSEHAAQSIIDAHLAGEV